MKQRIGRAHLRLMLAAAVLAFGFGSAGSALAAGDWVQTGSVQVLRVYHTATLLTDGKVLVTGGHTNGQFASLVSAEVYDPASGTWMSAGSMSDPRENHAAVLLPNGTVLVSADSRPSPCRA
jgi:Kelch motif